MLGAIQRIIKSRMLDEATSKSKNDVIDHTVKNIQNPPKIMQHRSKRDKEREEQLKYRDTAKRENIQLNNSVIEQKKSTNADILPVSGAGQLGTAKLMNTYKKDTPEQNITGFKSYKRTK